MYGWILQWYGYRPGFVNVCFHDLLFVSGGELYELSSAVTVCPS